MLIYNESTTIPIVIIFLVLTDVKIVLSMLNSIFLLALTFPNNTLDIASQCASRLHNIKHTNSEM